MRVLKIPHNGTTRAPYCLQNPLCFKVFLGWVANAGSFQFFLYFQKPYN